MADIDSIKKLPAKERLKKLKEYAEQKDKEKKEAEALLKKSADEITDEVEFNEKVPIPQVAAIDEKTLSEEERQLFRVHRFKRLDEKEESEPKRERKDQEMLEDVLEKEKISKPQEPVPLAQQPVRTLYTEVGRISQQAEQQGYITPQQMQRVEYITQAIEMKELSDYVPPTKEAARQMDLVQQRAERLQGIYNSQKEKGDKIRHSYSFKDDDEPIYKS